MIKRAEIIRSVDRNHLVAVSDGFPRRLKGHIGAEIIDFFAPHTYDIWSNGPEISKHANFLLLQCRDALPDRRRPVIIEEFGIQPLPQYPGTMRAKHIEEYLKAGKKWGLAGVLQWWDMDDEVFSAFAKEHPYKNLPQKEKKAPLAVFLSPGQDWNLAFYDRGGIRREWENVITVPSESLFDIKLVSSLEDIVNAKAILVLGDSLEDSEIALLKESQEHIVLTPEGRSIKEKLPKAFILPQSETLQLDLWQKILQKNIDTRKGNKKGDDGLILEWKMDSGSGDYRAAGPDAEHKVYLGMAVSRERDVKY